ncbi:hypothetical protein Vadar_010908 [Vaccinium darrowii]|nr:hypothetical protein Vadar_010908 [Vaccinium darrowii]
MGHTSWRKSHCRVRAELKAKKGGVDPDRIEVFTKTHTKSNGNPVDEASALAIHCLEEGASQIPPDSLERAALREELFTEVPKPDRNGWLHTYGLGPCRSQVFGTRYTLSQGQRIKDQLRAEVRQEVLAEVGGEIDLLKREYARMAAHMAVIGHPLPLSPNGNGDGDRDVGGDHTQSMSEHN